MCGNCRKNVVTIIPLGLVDVPYGEKRQGILLPNFPEDGEVLIKVAGPMKPSVESDEDSGGGK